jgi:hypothetical protein
MTAKKGRAFEESHKTLAAEKSRKESAEVLRVKKKQT